MMFKRTIDLLRRSLYVTRDTPAEPSPVGLPDGPMLRESDQIPELRTADGHTVSVVNGLIRISEKSGYSATASAGGWFMGLDLLEKSKAERLHLLIDDTPRTNSGWIEGPPKLLFRQYAIEHVFDNKSLPRGNAADRIDVRVFAGTLQCIDMAGWYYFAEPLSKLAPCIVRKDAITRHFLVPDADPV
jgi:hypothetical protein